LEKKLIITEVSDIDPSTYPVSSEIVMPTTFYCISCMLQEKLKESQYQITPWRAESSNNTSAVEQLPSHLPGNALVTSVCI
jgi:hypothetical protein